MHLCTCLCTLHLHLTTRASLAPHYTLFLTLFLLNVKGPSVRDRRKRPIGRFSSSMHKYMHIYVHIKVHIYLHMHMNMNINSLYVRACTYACSCMYVHSHVLARVHVCKYTYTNACMHVHSFSCMYALACTHAL